MDLSSNELPKRKIVPYTIQYAPDDITIDIDRDDVNTGLAYHDSFTANQEIYSKNHLTFVKAGQTVISLTYPYLIQGIVVSIAAAFLILGYTLSIRSRLRNSEKEVK